MKLGPRQDRAESATMPQRGEFVEGYVDSEFIPGLFVDESAATIGNPDRKTIEPGRGDIRVFSFREDADGKPTLCQSGRTQAIINLSTEPLPYGAHVRCAYDPNWSAFVPYYVNCSPWTLTDLATYEILTGDE